MKYFLVKCKCGHVGRTKYIEKQIPIAAKDAKEAAKIARQKGRVKHDDKYAIIEVAKLSIDDYETHLKIHASDEYFQVHSVQEQRARCPDVYNQVKLEEKTESYKKAGEKRWIVEQSILKEMNKHQSYKYDE